MDNHSESVTIILPFQINKEKEDIWENTSKLAFWLERHLSSFTIGKTFRWKLIEDNDEKAVGIEKAFESHKNLELFYQNFTPEVAETLYSNSHKIVHFLAVNGDESDKETVKEGILGLVKEENKMKVVSFREDLSGHYKIRKIHIAATVFGSCLLFFEIYKKTINSLDEIINGSEYWDIEKICESVGIIPKDKSTITYPTRCHPYIAKISWQSDCSESKTLYGKTSITRLLPHTDNDKLIENNILQFFGTTFECFWVNVLQKTVAMYISSWAGSNKISHKSFIDIYETYIMFDNQFNFLEVSFNPTIQNEYQSIKSSMEIDSNTDKLSRQIEALRSINQNKKDEKRNLILAFISLLSMVTGCMQVTESFGQTPDTCANIIAGVASFGVGIILLLLLRRG